VQWCGTGKERQQNTEYHNTGTYRDLRRPRRGRRTVTASAAAETWQPTAATSRRPSTVLVQFGQPLRSVVNALRVVLTSRPDFISSPEQARR